MDLFPQTQIGGLSVSRMVAGSNWFLGFSHQTAAKSHWIVQYHSAAKVADILEVFLAQGINLTMGTSPLLSQAIAHAQQRVGHKMHLIATPNFELTPGGPDYDVAARAFDECVQLGATFCWPHQCVTDALIDKMHGVIRDYLDWLCQMPWNAQTPDNLDLRQIILSPADCLPAACAPACLLTARDRFTTLNEKRRISVQTL